MGKFSNKSLAIIGVALVIVIAIVFLGLTQQTQTGFAPLQEQEIVTVGYLPLMANLPLFVALEEGYFEKHGVEVEAIEAQSPNHIVDAMVAGQMDGAGILAYPILFTAQEKYPGEIKIFQSEDETTNNFVSAIIVKNDSELDSIEDLKGKRIGVYTGLVQVLFLKGILIGMGFDPEKDVTIVEIEPRLQLQGLEAGQYDALSTVEPFPTIAVGQNLGKVLVENPRVKFIQNPFPSAAVPLSSEFIKNRPIEARAYVLAMNDAVEFIQNNPEKAKEYLAKYTPVPEDLTQNLNLFEFNKFGEEDRENVQKSADWMFENGLLKKRIDVDDLFGEAGFLE